MVRVNGKDDIEAAAEQMMGVIRNPATQVSKFYSLYYLDRVEELDGFDFYLLDAAREMRDAFLNYSVYACMGEISHLANHFRVANTNLDTIIHRANFGQARDEAKISATESERVINSMKATVRAENSRRMADIILDLMFNRMPSRAGKDSSKVESSMKIEEEKYGAFSNAEDILKAAKFIFGYEWDPVRVDFIDNEGNERQARRVIDGWSHSYGGRSWKMVAKTALMIDDLSPVPYVDLMWAVEHNNGNFVDKISDVTDEEKNTVVRWINHRAADKGLFDGKEPHYTPVEGGGRYSTDGVTDNTIRRAVLPAILDMNEAGNIEPLHGLAKRRHKELADRRIRAMSLPKTKDIFAFGDIMAIVRGNYPV